MKVKSTTRSVRLFAYSVDDSDEQMTTLSPVKISSSFEEHINNSLSHPVIHRQIIAPPFVPSQSVKPVWNEFVQKEDIQLQPVPKVHAVKDEEWQQKEVHIAVVPCCSFLDRDKMLRRW